MIGSRAAGLLRSISRNPVNQKSFTAIRQQVRHSSDSADEWCYRTGRPAAAWAQRGGTACAVLCWWWFYWNLYHGWPHLIGLYDGDFLPDPRKDFTDEELGIPPDNE